MIEDVVIDTMKKVITFKHSANAGDLVASLAGIKKICEERNSKAVIYQRVDMPAFYYHGAVHPVKNNEGVDVCMNEKMFNMIKHLVMMQDYVDDMLIWEGERADFDLDEIRNHFVNMPYGNIQRWFGYVYPQLHCDLSKEWVETTMSDVSMFDKIIINFTSRYRNNQIAYFFLKEHIDNLLFVGTDNEYELFKHTWKLDELKRLEITNFEEFSFYLIGCKFFLGNASVCYNIAEAMKVPRILESCSFAPSCTPHGENGYDFYHQASLEYFFNKLNK